MSAEVIRFPRQSREDRLTEELARLDELAGEIERFLPDGQNRDLNHLLDVTKRLSDRLVNVGYLLLDPETKHRLETASDALTHMIAQTRQALDEIATSASP